MQLPGLDAGVGGLAAGPLGRHSGVGRLPQIQQMRKAGQLPLVLPYLESVQTHNIAVVNEAINELYVEGEQFDELRASMEDFGNFDQIISQEILDNHPGHK